MDWEIPEFLAGLGCGLCIGITLFAFKNVNNVKETVKVIKKFSSRSEYKLVLVVRTDLNMNKGKIAAQCSHAAVAAFETAQKKDPESLAVWRYSGQAKIALKANSLEEIENIAENAKNIGLITSPIRDDGRTQVAHNTLTVLGIGPAPKDVIDKVTGHLKLL